jgi:transcriptional regulator with XRE-family HTH domain
MAVARKKHIEYIEYLKERTGMSLSALAKTAGLADSTLTRFLAKKEYQRLSTATLDRLAKAAGFDSYEDYLVETHQADGAQSDTPIIDDATKFATYESVKRLLSKGKNGANPSTVTFVSQEVISHAGKLKTDFISDSLIMYVIERLERENKI